MSAPFRGVSRGALKVLADSIEGGRLAPPFTSIAVRRLLGTADAETVSMELRRLADTGMKTAHLAYLLQAIAEERASGQKPADKVELVWTGPETLGSGSRETSVVVRELFAKAQKKVLIAGFAITHGKHVFRELGERMEQLPGLQVRMFLNVARPSGNDEPSSQILRAFVESFLRDHWPGGRHPEVFYDPRALQLKGKTTYSLHAKCVVLDDQETFVTSANFTAAGHERNIEVGALIRDSGFAAALRAQFESLVEVRILQRVPGL